MTAICGNLAKYIETSGDVLNESYNSDFRLGMLFLNFYSFLRRLGVLVC